jgi:hypothetical protein
MSSIEEKKTQKTKTSCNICCENRTTFVKCLYCNFDACSDCTQKYLLENIDAKCMSCYKGWSLEFIQTNFSHTFVHKKYKEHRENIFLEKEKSLLPQTQMILENRNKVKQMNSQIAKHRELIYNLEQEVLFLNGNQNVYKKRQEKIVNCIVNDCRGFLTPNGQHTLKCGICNITVCKGCRERRDEKESKEEDHKCDPQVVESIKAIEKECRPCPKCGSYIYKISGCDQVWCTQCRTAFSWKTGQVETGVVHNPHYWEYIRQHGNEDDEVRRQFGQNNQNNDRNNLDNLVNLNECDFRFENLVFNRDFMTRLDGCRQEISELLREISHCQRYEIPRTRVDIHDPKINEDIRLKYLENEINEKKFKMTIQRRQKMNEFKQELVQVLETFVTVFRESTIRYYRLIMELPNSRDKKINGFIKQWVTELRQVRDFTFNSIEKLCERFNYTFTISLRDHFESYIRLSDIVFRKLDTSVKIDKKKEEEKKQIEHNFINGIYSRGFRTYSEEMREVMKEKFINKTGREIAKELFNLWKNMPIDVKNYYKELELSNEKKAENEEKKENDDDEPLFTS